MLEFVWPQTNGEWLAWISALTLVITGLLLFIMPGRWLLLMQVNDVDIRRRLAAEIRSGVGGINLGLGVGAMLLHPQPLLYLGIGSALLFMAVGRLISIFTDLKNWKIHLMLFAGQSLLAFFPLAYAVGWVA